MSSIFKIFDPLWALIGRNTFLSAGVLAVAFMAAALLHRPFLTLLLGMAACVIVMLKSERMLHLKAGYTEPPHVHIGPPST
ncbi:hypothetical protein [Roseomonas chloroacetimidivorans]|jgi:hypothetical protein|uniref:hypothetical protein n=1 Tax=Roseomonas chloroacetimidivorans TaxID=1766656 RepID=UPI003C710F9B